MKILELTTFTSGGCGVLARAKFESELFSQRGHEVIIMSSNLDKGTDEIVPAEDKLEEPIEDFWEHDIKIFRYPAIKLGGESFMYWFNDAAFKKAIEFKPDLIIAHNYRHLHTTKALKLGKQLGVPVWLVTHAPFVEGNITRTKLQSAIVALYDKFIGRDALNKFDKVLAISKWEIPVLEHIGIDKKKIVYSPNGVPSEFFTMPKQAEEENKILFLGRVSPKKKLQTLIECIPHLKDKNIKIEIVGPVEKEYFDLIKNLDKTGRVIFSPAVYDLKEKIKKIDSCKIFVLPSRVEGQPQSLLEALSRGKTVIGSDSIAIRDIISDGVTGYLFEFDNPVSLAGKINYALDHPLNAKEQFRQFNWDLLIQDVEMLFSIP